MSIDPLPDLDLERAIACAPRILDALRVLRASRDGATRRTWFDLLFGAAPADRVEVRARDATSALAELQAAGLAACDSGLWSSPFAFAAYPTGGFYMSDRARRDKDEVFAAHFEQKALVDLLQVRPRDAVLDLCTGNGVLAIEAARRGADVLGVDINERALRFARFNASLNGVEQRVEFRLGDVCRAEQYEAWGKPDVVVSNPPFEPSPFELPRHSGSGIDGMRFLVDMGEALSQWRHAPAAVQLVLFSLSAGIGPAAWGQAPSNEALASLSVGPPLTRLAASKAAALEVKEVAPPITLGDLCVLQGIDSSPQGAADWCAKLRANGQISEAAADETVMLHLVVGQLYAGATAARDGRPGVSTWTARHEGEECFVLPLDPARNASAAGVLQSYLASLTEIRELQNEGKVIDLNLHDSTIASFLSATVRSPSLFGPRHDLLIVDVRPGEALDRVRGLVVTPTVPGGAPSPVNLTGRAAITEQLQQWSETELSATICDVLSGPPYIRTALAAGSSAEQSSSFLALPADAIQRFVAVSNWPAAALSPIRQVVMANVLSELCYTAQHTHNLAEAVAHEYRNRTTQLADLSANVKNDLKNRGIETVALKAKLEAMIAYGQMLNAMSTGLLLKVRGSQELADVSNLSVAERKSLIAAAARVMLHLKSLSTRGRRLLVRDEGITLAEAQRRLGALLPEAQREGEIDLSDLLQNQRVGLFCLAVSEVIHNIRPDVLPGPGVKVPDHLNEVQTWVVEDQAPAEVRVYQRTVEYAVKEWDLPSRGVDLVNQLLPEGFANPDPVVRFVSVENIPGSPAKHLTRYTSITVKEPA